MADAQQPLFQNADEIRRGGASTPEATWKV
jgi:hypothetical protein